MISSSDILHAKVLIVDNEEFSALLLERLLRGARLCFHYIHDGHLVPEN